MINNNNPKINGSYELLFKDDKYWQNERDVEEHDKQQIEKWMNRSDKKLYLLMSC